MKTTKQHLDALLAVEGDSKFDGLAQSVKTLRRKQNVQTHSQSAAFEWIKTSRELSQLEHNMTQQLEKIQNDLGLLTSPRTQEQLELDALSLVIGLKDALEVSQDKNKSRRREMILDTKQRLNKMEENLEQQCAALEEETRMQRHRALQLVSDGNKQCNILPPSLLKALDSLCTMVDEDSEVELLKQELLGELEAAKHKRDKIHYEKIKKKGLGDVERLRKRIIEKSRISTNKAKNEAKQQELKTELKILRLQQQLSDTQNQESSKPNSKVADEKVIDVQKRLEAMQLLAKHQLRQVQDHEKENAEVLLQEEMMKQRKMCFNKERSTFRQEQRQQKLIAQQEAEDKMTRERELQLEMLSTLAMSCPSCST